MALIAQTSVGAGPVTVSRTTLSASDTIAYVQGAGQVLLLHNNTAGSLTATINGSVVQTITVPGYGGGTVSTASGKAITVAAGSTAAIELDSISAYLGGTVTVTGAATMTATLHV